MMSDGQNPGQSADDSNKSMAAMVEQKTEGEIFCGSQANFVQTSKPSKFPDGSGDQVEKSDKINSNCSAENSDSANVISVGCSTSLSCSSADIHDFSPSNADSGFEGVVDYVGGSVRSTGADVGTGPGEALDACSAEAITDSTETTSEKLGRRGLRKGYKSRNYRSRARICSSSDEDEIVRNEDKVKDPKTSTNEAITDVALAPSASANKSPRGSASNSKEGGSLTTATSEIENAPTSEAGCNSKRRRQNDSQPSLADEEETADNSSEENGTSRTSRRRVRGNRLSSRTFRNRTPSFSSTSTNSSAITDERSEQADDNAAPSSMAPPSSSESAEMASIDSDTSVSSSTTNSIASTQIRGLNRSFHGSSNDSINSTLASTADSQQNKACQDVLNKPKPVYTWNSTYELMRREHGLSGNGRYSLRNGFSYGFNSRFYSSRHVVERMSFSHPLRKHNGCVNCLNFSRSGDFLCSGSDDTQVIVWDWAHNKVKLSYSSGHTANIFQTKFLETSNISGFDIISAGRDGEVRHAVIPPSGGDVSSVRLYKHKGAVHKLVLCPRSPMEIISVGEDGFIRYHDMRKESEASSTLKLVKSKDKRVRLFSISHHPFKPEIAVCGCDRFVRVYDKRHMDEPVNEMCPKDLIDTRIPQVTCCVYNCTGSEILASYSDEHIYLFSNSATAVKGDFLHQYRGHYNSKTIKGVNFFGPNSEYVISGSDCSNIFFWDKNTEAILNCMAGDTMGVVNCLEPHPSVPILATSGLDHNIKIWAPTSKSYPPDLSKLGDRVKRNLRRSVFEEGTALDNRQFVNFIRIMLNQSQAFRARNRTGSEHSPEAEYMNGSLMSESLNTSSDDDDDEDEEHPPVDGLDCRTQ